jgi:hypothetical protein
VSDKGFRVTIEDLEAGTKETMLVPNNDYYLLATGSCFVANTQVYPKSGTHVLTIKGRGGKRAPSTTDGGGE